MSDQIASPWEAAMVNKVDDLSKLVGELRKQNESLKKQNDELKFQIACMGNGLRFQAACAALSGMVAMFLTRTGGQLPTEDYAINTARVAFVFADALIAEAAKGPQS